MENIDLDRLNPIAFERLVRALCFATMGPAGTVYSSGPDGGRDFTYSGKIAGYEAKRWSGYLVVQAKFKDPSVSKIDDLSWLKTQLAKELKKYSGTRMKKPQYYIVVTNVRLSGTDGTANKKSGSQRKGGHTKALELLSSWKAELGLKAFDIWSYDKIVDLLAAQPEIRQTYAHWITTGDVLAKALERLQSNRPNFGDVVSRALKISLQRDQYVRLKDAGSVGDPQIRTSQVIVDLPLARNSSEPPHFSSYTSNDDYDHGDDYETATYKVPPTAIALLVDRAREKLDAETLLADEDRLEKQERFQARNRIVLMGGPGQGKSTASLFLAQIFRASLLAHQPNTRRDQGVKYLVPEILRRAANESISISLPARYPLHISLPRFADSISIARQAKVNLPSLLAHIAMELSACADQEVDRSDLRNWLRHYPWLLILDGLDEVPPSGERPAILDAITNFFTEVSEVNADILVVVTTRPQGYNKDLDEKLWEHWRLADLDPKQALSYAKAFGEARYPEDAPRREEVHRALIKAAAQPATARLMVSPLQVTILHFIVDTGGGVPTARWTLFHEYFEVLKRREKAKGGELQKFLERHWGHLGPIHQRAGLVLQTDSEHAGGAGSSFTQERFRRLIQNYLASEGFEKDDLSERVDELMQLALNRLVLLSQQVEGTISFDVRSLQEFMAAAAMTSGDELIMEHRLSHIAGHSHWRHVFQIAASRCFADDSFHYRRATVIQIARQIDATEPDMIVRNGARLALDLLADGIGLDHPNSRRPLLQHALEQVDLGPGALDDRLAGVCDSSTADIVESHIAPKILEASGPTKICAWKLLFKISQLGHAWADELILRLWPGKGKLRDEIMKELAYPLGSQRIADHIADSLSKSGPTLGVSLFSFSHQLDRGRREEKVDHSRLRRMNFARFYMDDTTGREESKLLSSSFGDAFIARFIPIDSGDLYSEFSGNDFENESWSVINKMKMFVSSPNKSTLAATLRSLTLHDYERASTERLARFLPWPVACLILDACELNDFEGVALEVEAGIRGDIEDWRAAEKRWIERGIMEDDLLAGEPGRWFDSGAGNVGTPLWANDFESVDQNGIAFALRLNELAAANKNKGAAEMIATAAAAVVAFGPTTAWKESEANKLLDILMAAPGYPNNVTASISEEMWKDIPTLERLAKIFSSMDSYDYQSHPVRKLLWGGFFAHPSLESLIYPLTLAVLLEESDAGTLMAQLLAAVPNPPVDPSAKGAIAVLGLMNSADGAIEKRVKAALEDQTKGGLLLQLLLKGDLVPIEKRLAILTTIISKAREESSEEWREYITLTLRALDSRKSGLVKADIWKDLLRLPAEAYPILLPFAS